MRDVRFDISESFKSIANGLEISRDDLIFVLKEVLDAPHIDILFAKLCANSSSK